MQAKPLGLLGCRLEQLGDLLVASGGSERQGSLATGGDLVFLCPSG